ncbi:MAG TPA: twin-arginine translocation signal domain-containing protein, partial [Longimicrobiales bacterium]|nr:twin-arginine translocation signal domain-containing protein [Longimicrobiales bacterium]
MSTVDRRSFLKGLAAAAACTAVDVQATGASAPVRSAATWRPAPCTLCSAGCELLVDIRDGRAAAVKPAVGGSACAKGYHILQTLRAPDRLTRARIRRDGVLADAPLGDALELVARRLADTIARHGVQSAALLGPAEWSGCDGSAGQDFFRNVLGARFVDTESRLDGGSGSAGL